MPHLTSTQTCRSKGNNSKSLHLMECLWPSTIQNIPLNLRLTYSFLLQVEWKQSSPDPKLEHERLLEHFASIQAAMET